ncbi:hypothetical protein NFI96_018444 [Prochilodus magdalenae]|nr:hypothetical protein NFI96_018444 [Prochilodus magdalenae]
MWRVQGLVGRVLSRCHGNGPPLRLSNGHHVEDEVISSSTVLSSGRHATDSSSQRGENGEEKKKKRTSQFCYDGLARYSALDAVGWGAAAVLFVQVCRRIHSQFSSVGEQSPGPPRLREPGLIPKCTYRILLDILSRRDMLPRGVSVMCLKGALTSPNQSDSSGESSSSGDADPQPVPDLHATQTSSQQRETLGHSREEETSPDVDVPEAAASNQEQPQEDHQSRSLEEAVQNLRDVGDNSVPIILNIIGLESAKAGNHEAAFECFLASAQQDYSKAQFNVGVCYERGRGVAKDLSKALQYYRRAAEAGHRQAQYRCAKLLLNSRGQQSASHADSATAISLLHKAAAAGLTEAQLYLGVLFSENADADGRKSVQYFRMAAESGDSTGLLFLGQCYERGFGVPQCFSTAVSLYQQAAEKGNQEAKNALRDLHSREVLRSIRSAPCLSILDQLHLSAMFPTVSQQAGPDSEHPDWPTLSHSWSTGNLISPTAFSAQTLNANSKSGGWIIGVG